MKIMLIDDDQSCMQSLVGAMEPAGYDCEMFSNPLTALEAFAAKIYDVVVTDLKMPQMSGLEVLQAIRNLNAEAKVILNTAYGDPETISAVLKNGAHAIFVKPIKIEDFLKTIGQIDDSGNPNY